MFKMSPLACILCKRLKAAMAAKSWSLFAVQSNDQMIWAAEVDKKGIEEAYTRRRTDRNAGVEKFLALAEAGSVWAMTCVAFEIQSIDKAEAEKWYRRAYERGSDRGLIYLGNLYFNEGEFSKAEDILQVGVKRGFAIANYLLALIYLRPPATSERLAKARNLLKEAASQGDDYAASVLANYLVRGRFGFMRIPAGVALFISMLSRLDTIVGNDPLWMRLGEGKLKPPVFEALPNATVGVSHQAGVVQGS